MSGEDATDSTISRSWVTVAHSAMWVASNLIDDVEQRLFAVLPDQTWVYPGHGKDTTLGAERPHLGEWRARGW